MSAKTGLESEEMELTRNEWLRKLGSLTSKAWHAIEAKQRSQQMTELLLTALTLFKSDRLDGPILSIDDRLPMECDVRGDDPRLFVNFPWLWQVHSFWRSISIVDIRIANSTNVVTWFRDAIKAGVYCEDAQGHYRMYHEVNYIDRHAPGPFATRDRSISAGDAVRELMKDPFLWERQKMRIRFLVFTDIDCDNTFMFRPPLHYEYFDEALKQLAAETR